MADPFFGVRLRKFGRLHKCGNWLYWWEKVWGIFPWLCTTSILADKQLWSFLDEEGVCYPYCNMNMKTSTVFQLFLLFLSYLTRTVAVWNSFVYFLPQWNFYILFKRFFFIYQHVTVEFNKLYVALSYTLVFFRCTICYIYVQSKFINFWHSLSFSLFS